MSRRPGNPPTHARDRAPGIGRSEVAVQAVIVTFNSASVVRRCLTSLRPLLNEHVQAVVVDNASSDGTDALVREEFPDVDLVETGANLGYTGGNNRGIAAAFAKNARYVLLLNPDTVVENPGFVDEMIAFMESRPEVGVVGPRVFLRDRRVVQNTVLREPGLLRNLWQWFAFRLKPSAFELSGDTVREAEVLNGVCLMLRSSCLQAVGLFDEDFFAYVEDVDLQHRMRAAGWRVVYAPIDSVIHLQRIDAYGMTSLVSFLLRRNTVYFLTKIESWFDAWGYAVASALLMLLRGVLSFRSGPGLGYLEFVRRLVRTYGLILLKRPLDEGFGPPHGSWREAGADEATQIRRAGVTGEQA